MSDITNVPDYLKRVEFSSPESILREYGRERHGERFEEYRDDYARLVSTRDFSYLPETPVTVTVELVNRCNLTCQMCYTENHRTTKFTLTPEALDSIVDEIASFGKCALLLGAGSEGLLYKDIRRVIGRAQEKGVIDTLLMSNGTLLNESIAEFLVDQKVPRLCISLDAARPETFAKIRGKNELAKIEANIHRLVEIKRRKGAKLPIIRLSFCMQDDNRDEEEEFKAKWAGVVDYLDFQRILDFSHVDTVAETKVPEGALESRPFCHRPFGYMNVWSNGDVSPCCNFYGKNLTVGNVYKESLRDIWKGANMNRLREEFRSGKINKTCQVCLSMRENEVADAEKPY